MPTIHYLPDDQQVEVTPQETILAASLRAGIPHAHACGGNAQCSTCRVWILSGLEHCAPRNERERRLAEPLHLTERVRLACQTTVAGDVLLRRLVLDDDDLEITSQLGQTSLTREGEEQSVAVLFADIRGFTSFAEPLPPYDVIFVLNRFFHQMGKAISEHGGTIENYMGDGLMALFGVDQAADPRSVEGAPLRAIRAGLQMLEHMEALSVYLVANYHRRLDVGVGIHYGRVVLGTVGYGESRRRTAIGDSVNLASRIESANKDAGTRLLVSESTFGHVNSLVRAGRRITLDLKGKAGKHALVEISGLAPGVAGDDQPAETADEQGVTWSKVLPEAALAAGPGSAGQPVKVGGQSLLLFSAGETLLAVQSHCPHMGLPLNRAKITVEQCLICPWHHSMFDLATGEPRQWAPWPPILAPALSRLRQRRSLHIYPARRKDGYVWVALDNK